MRLQAVSLRNVSALILLVWYVVLGKAGYAASARSTSLQSNQTRQIGELLRVRKILHHEYFVSRYPRIHYFLLYSTVRVSDQNVCAEYETPVLDEIDDLFSAMGKHVEVEFRGFNLTVRTPGGRKLKTHLVKATQSAIGLTSGISISQTKPFREGRDGREFPMPCVDLQSPRRFARK
jgi:hypothetical protein